MRYLHLLLYIVIIIFLPEKSLAGTNPIEACFKEETNGSISLCLTIEYNKADELKNIIRDDISQMIEDDLYLPPPKYDVSDDYITISPETNKVDSSILQSQIDLQEKQNLMKARQYQIKKRSLVEQLNKTSLLFVEYRELECKRRKANLDQNTGSFLAIFSYKVCLYNMTQQRIISLQKSVE